MGRPFDLTYVEFEDGDHVGHVLALISLAPIFLVVMFVTLLASRRDLATGSFFLGQLMNEVINKVLKRVIKQERPPGSPSSGAPGYGMPSNHAQFLYFFAVYATLFAFTRLKSASFGFKTLVAWAVQALAFLVAVSRVYLGYHTVAQVAVGALVGSGAAAGWFFVVNKLARPLLFPVIAAWPLSKALYIRDCTSCQDVVAAEYAAVQRPKKW